MLLQELTILTERLGRINEDLARKLQARNEFDATIQETEAAYMKVRQEVVTHHDTYMLLFCLLCCYRVLHTCGTVCST